jgi:hypothetical protein
MSVRSHWRHPVMYPARNPFASVSVMGNGSVGLPGTIDRLAVVRHARKPVGSGGNRTAGSA